MDKLDRIQVPADLSEETLCREFGVQAVQFYQNRIQERIAAGRIYLHPLKTIYLWATKDKATGQGFYTTYRGYSHGRKHKDRGGS